MSHVAGRSQGGNATTQHLLMAEQTQRQQTCRLSKASYSTIAHRIGERLGTLEVWKTQSGAISITCTITVCGHYWPRSVSQA